MRRQQRRLDEAGADAASYALISATREVGHLAEVHFRSVGEGNLAKAKVRALKKSRVAGKMVFMNVAKTVEELKPGRMAFKASKELETLELEFEELQRKTVSMDRFRGSVLVDGARVGFVTSTCAWTWMPAAVSRYDAQKLAMSKLWIDAC